MTMHFGSCCRVEANTLLNCLVCAPTGTFPFPFLEAEHFLSAIRISFSVVEHCSSPQFDRTAAWRSKEHAEFQLVVRMCAHVVSWYNQSSTTGSRFWKFLASDLEGQGCGNWTLTNFTTSSKTSPVSVGHLQCSETSVTHSHSRVGFFEVVWPSLTQFRVGCVKPIPRNMVHHTPQKKSQPKSRPNPSLPRSQFRTLIFGRTLLPSLANPPLRKAPKTVSNQLKTFGFLLRLKKK